MPLNLRKRDFFNDGMRGTIKVGFSPGTPQKDRDAVEPAIKALAELVKLRTVFVPPKDGMKAPD